MVDASDFDFSIITEASTVLPANQINPATGVDHCVIPAPGIP